MSILSGITVLLVYQLVGEVTVFFVDLPVPGPVVGLLLLLVTLMIRGGVGESLDRVSKTLLSHLSLLFVPAGVGVMVHFGRIETEWVSMGTALVLSTVFSLLFNVLLLRLMSRTAGRGDLHG